MITVLVLKLLGGLENNLFKDDDLIIIIDDDRIVQNNFVELLLNGYNNKFK